MAVREQPQGAPGGSVHQGGTSPRGGSSWALPIPCSAYSSSGDPACWVCRLLGPVAESARMQNQDPRRWGRGRPVPVLAMPPALPGARDRAGVHRLRGCTCVQSPKEPRGVLSPGVPFIPVTARSSLRCTPLFLLSFIQFSSVAQSCPTVCDPMDCSTPGLPVHYQLPEFTQTHVHRVRDAIQPSHPLLSPSPALNLSQHQGLFK